MGEYWCPINVTRKEFVHPHRLDCGLKWGEWVHPGSNVFKAVEALVASGRWSWSDNIRIASDYGGETEYPKPPYDGVDEYDRPERGVGSKLYRSTYREDDDDDDGARVERFADVSSHAAELAGLRFRPDW